eukprot:Amastigsp_a174837_577.p2 type:complete len:329 gc:universal Amastigsp_a174837_577:59-1045(+)
MASAAVASMEVPQLGAPGGVPAPNISVRSEAGAGVWTGGLADALRAKAVSHGDDLLDPLEKKRIQASLGAGKATNTSYFVRKSGVRERLGAIEGATVDDGVSTLYFRECEDSVFEIDVMSAKIMVDLCKNCSFVVRGKIVTATIEMYKCENAVVELGVATRTIQADLCDGVRVLFSRREDFDRVVWAGTEGLCVSFADHGHSIETGYTPMTVEHGPLLRRDIDQFIVRSLDGAAPICERLVRLDNGFPTTARERAAFEERQERNMREFAKRVYGEDIQIPKKKRTTTKVLPNQPCPCGKAAKYKKCCANKPGVEFSQEQIDLALERKK